MAYPIPARRTKSSVADGNRRPLTCVLLCRMDANSFEIGFEDWFPKTRHQADYRLTQRRHSPKLPPP